MTVPEATRVTLVVALFVIVQQTLMLDLRLGRSTPTS